MKDAELVVAAAGPNVPGVQTPSTNESFEHVSVDPAAVRRLALARALQLGPLLHVYVVVDNTGWLSRDVEIVYQRERENTIHPITVRVGRDARDEDVLADGGAFGICRKYNAALDDLRQLAIRLAATVREGRIAVPAGSDLEEAQRELSGLAADILSRQMKYMGNSVVRLDRLRSEIAHFEGRHAHLLPIVIAAEREAHPTWDADTEELELDA
jgi:hypothetical protein